MVTVSEAVSQDVPVYLDQIGTCTAREVVSVHPQITGQITDINFVDGADIKKGDPLFIIDPRPSQAALVVAQASLAQSGAGTCQIGIRTSKDTSSNRSVFQGRI